MAVVVMSVEEEDKDEGGEDQPVLSSSTHHSEQGHQEHTDHSLHGYDVNSSSSSSQPSANTSSSHTTIESHTLAEHSKSPHMKSYPEYLQSYQHNLQQIQEAHESEPANKYSIIYNAYFKGKLLSDLLDPMLKKIRNCAGECDFAFSPLIRILYLNQDLYPIPDPSSLYTWQEQIVATMLKFPYWPDGISAKMDDIVFWSENHLFMTLSASYLVHQYAIDRKYVAQGTVALEDRLESKLLRKYLQVHQHELFSGVYEVNSHVYLPYSLAALMNLYDFANDEEIKCLSKALIDKIVYHVMLSTDPRHGIANLTASTRAFDRTRQRPFGHNINQLVNALNGHSCDDFQPSFLTGFIVTTKWQPDLRIFEALHFTGFEGGLLMSHPLSALESIYQGHHEDGSFAEDDNDHWTPLFWSAGLVVHHKYANRTRAFQAKYKMQHNQHLWPLSFFFFTDSALRKTMKCYRHFSSGQKYTGIVLNVYKDASYGLVMTSFQMYNPHYCGFQQMPWMINLGGVPVYSRSGLGSESIAGFGIHNTHNPAVMQLGSLMLVSYVSPAALRSFPISTIFSSRIHLFWPSKLFENGFEACTLSDHCGGERQWFVGVHKDCFIAACFTTKKYHIAQGDDKDSFFQVKERGPKLEVDKIYTDDRRASIVLLCGTKTHFASLEDFIKNRVSQVIILDGVSEKKMYFVMVHDPWEKRDGVDGSLRYECNKDSPYASEEN